MQHRVLRLDSTQFFRSPYADVMVTRTATMTCLKSGERTTATIHGAIRDLLRTAGRRNQVSGGGQ